MGCKGKEDNRDGDYVDRVICSFVCDIGEKEGQGDGSLCALLIEKHNGWLLWVREAFFRVIGGVLYTTLCDLCKTNQPFIQGGLFGDGPWLQ